MQSWVADGLVVGLATAVLGGGVSMVLPGNSGASLLGSSLGAITSSTILAKRQRQALAELESQFQDAQALLLAAQAEASVTQTDISTTSALLEQLEADQVDQVQKVSSEPDFSIQQQDEAIPDTALVTGKTTHSIRLQHQSEEIIINWLSTKGIKVEDYRLSDPSVDEIFNKHAIFLGDNLKDANCQPLLAPLLKQIKWSISQNRGVQYHLKNSTQVQIRVLTQFCRDLRDDTLLSSYYYSKNEKIIHAAVQDRKDIRSFFNGEWFERFVCHKIYELLQNLRLSYSCLLNPIIKFPNGDSFELDLLFLVEGKPLLVECKTGGDFSAHLKQFSDHRKRLSISSERAFLVLLDLEDSQTERLSQFWKFKVVNQNNLVSLIQGLYCGDPQSSRA